MAGDINVDETLIILPEVEMARAGSFKSGAAEAGARVTQFYGPRVMIAEVPADKRDQVMHAVGTDNFAAAPQDLAALDSTGLDPVGALGLAAFRLRQSDAYIKAKQQRPHNNVAWDAGNGLLPPNPPPDVRESLSPSPGQSESFAMVYGTTSQQMTGRIAVGIIIVSGPTQDLQFSAHETQKVIAEVQNGLAWLAAQNNLANITWHYDIQQVSVNVQPGSADKEGLWRNPAMVALGYQGNWQGIIDYIDHIKAAHDTQWTYVAYFTKYPLEHFAYATMGGPRLVMDYGNDGWGPDNIDRVFAHETGHIFQAPDEYSASGCNCGGAYGIYNQPNGNCQPCAPGGGVNCIMRQNTWDMCYWTSFHFGFPGAPVFTVPAVGENGISMGSSPAMASFNNKLYCAFQANDSGHALFVTSSSDGSNWVTPAVGYEGIRIGSAPALAEFNSKLYCAFQANDSGHALFVTSSSDGSNWVTPAVGYEGIRIGSAPALAEFNSKLYCAFQANDDGQALCITSSADGSNWTTPAVGYDGIRIGGAPSLAVFEGRLYCAFQANDGSNTLYVTSSADGSNWTTPAVGYNGIQLGGPPCLTVFEGQLFCSFQANDGSNMLYVTSTSDGTTWLSPAKGYPGIHVGSTPTMAVFNNALYLGLQANDPSHLLYVSSATQ